MGRSSRQQADRNRTRIVEAASRLFRGSGVENVSVADVMNAVDMTPGGFYKHFESKEALVGEALELAFEQSATRWQHVCGHPGPDARSGLDALIQHYFKRRAPEYSCPMLAFASYVNHETSSACAADVYDKGAEMLFRQFLEQIAFLNEGTQSVPISETKAMVLFAAMIGAGLLARSAGNKDWIRSIQSAVQHAAD